MSDLPTKAFVAQLFLRMQSTFGHKWLSLVPDETTQALAIHEWRHQLAGLSEDEIEVGFQRMLKRTGDKGAWPPGVAEFRALCRPHRELYERAEFQARALPQLPADRATAEHHLAKLRGQIGGDSVRGES